MFLKKTARYFKNLDWITQIIVIFFVYLGIMAIYGISLSGGGDLSNFKKQIWFGLTGLIIFFLLLGLDYKFLKNYSNLLYAITIVLLIAVLISGRVIRGTRGWFEIYGFRLQPVEIAKIFLIISLAKFFSSRIYEPRNIFIMIKSGIIASLAIIPTILQPDMGSVFILFMIWSGMLLLYGIKKSHFIIMIILIASLALSSWFFVLKEYQKDRIYIFLNADKDPLGAGYNVTQSIIAVGAGKLKGKGLAFGSQSQLKFLPETKTDFIFSVLSEELGFIIIALIFIGWIIIFYRLCYLAKKTKDPFAYFLTAGIAIFLFLHIFINIGVSIGILPVTGIPLPFMSYGGSFMITCFIAMGIIENIQIQSKNNN